MSKQRGASPWGIRRIRNRPAKEVIKDAVTAQSRLNERLCRSYGSAAEIRSDFVGPAKAYFSLAAMTRRGTIDEDLRQDGLSLLYGFRSQLERNILQQIDFNSHDLDLIKFASGDAFFGCSIKQGVSVRYPLLSCVPTAKCGPGCYAHDGRDRALIQIFRGVMNYHLGLSFERASAKEREKITTALGRSLDKAVLAARADAERAAVESGFARASRIRLSHVGEMASTPDFTNMLARELKLRDPRMQCVIYTRHPSAGLLDADSIVVNFTVEGSDDSRWAIIPERARVVGSAWNGEVIAEASINFLEHHVEKTQSAQSKGNLCPVTVDHAKFPSCDSARCARCFVNTDPARQRTQST